METLFAVTVERTRRGVVYVVAEDEKAAVRAVDNLLLTCRFSDIEVEESENQFFPQAAEDAAIVRDASRHGVIETDGSYVCDDWDEVMRERLGMGEVPAEGGVA